jgi:transposase
MVSVNPRRLGGEDRDPRSSSVERCNAAATEEGDGIGNSTGSGEQWQTAYRTVEEKRWMVEETLADGVSVAVVGRRHGANANEVFHWRKLYQSRLLELQQHNAAQLLPVTMVDEAESGEGQNASAAGPSNGAIHIELPGRALVSAEGRVEAPLARAVLENLLG